MPGALSLRSTEGVAAGLKLPLHGRCELKIRMLYEESQSVRHPQRHFT
jgi:hypothetical protein